MNHTSVFISIAATVLAAAVVFTGVRPVSLQKEREHAATSVSSESPSGEFRRGRILSAENQVLVGVDDVGSQVLYVQGLAAQF